MKEIIISQNEAGQRVNKFLLKYLNKAPSSFVYKMMRKKNIKLNNKKIEGNEYIYIGDTIQIYMSDETIANFEKMSAGQTALPLKEDSGRDHLFG